MTSRVNRGVNSGAPVDEVNSLRARDLCAVLDMVRALDDLKAALVESIPVLYSEQSDRVARHNHGDEEDPQRAAKAKSKSARAMLTSITSDMRKATARLREDLPAKSAHVDDLDAAVRLLGAWIWFTAKYEPAGIGTAALASARATYDLLMREDAPPVVARLLGRAVDASELARAVDEVSADFERVVEESGRETWSREVAAMIVIADLGGPGLETMRKRLKGER